jgi:hypothetical protein
VSVARRGVDAAHDMDAAVVARAMPNPAATSSANVDATTGPRRRPIAPATAATPSAAISEPDGPANPVSRPAR